MKGIAESDLLVNQLQLAWRVESDCVQAVGSNLDPVVDVVHRIRACSGKVVLTGVGKSGLLCERVGASLASIGINSTFLHSYEAMHGGIGTVRQNDLVIAVSHSGETKEVVELTEVLRSRGVSTVAITSGATSRLAATADAVVLYPEVESCVYQFLPTSSLTSVNVVFNLVLVGLTIEGHLREQDLAENHPNGSLGLRFFKTARDYCRTNCPEIEITGSLREAILAINEGVFGMCFVSRNGHRVGILTSGDIRRSLLQGDVDVVKVKDIYTNAPALISPDASAYEARVRMREHGHAFLVVADEGEMLGIVQAVDIV